MSRVRCSLLALIVGSFGCAAADEPPGLDEAAACDDGGGDGECDEATRLSQLSADIAGAVDLTAAAQAQNPVVNTGDGCNSVKVFVSSIEHGPAAAAVAPAPDGSSVRLSLPALVVRGQVRYRVACINATGGFTVTAESYRLEGVIAPRVEDGAVAVAFDGGQSSFTGLELFVQGAPDSIVDLIFDQAVDRLAEILRDALVPDLVTGIDAFLAGPAVDELAGSLADHIRETDFTAVLLALNPIVNSGSGCTRARVFVDTVQHGAGQTTLEPVPGGIAADFSAGAFTVGGQIRYRLVCINATSRFSLTAEDYTASGLLVPRVEGGAVAASLEVASGAFTGLALDATGLPDIVIDLVAADLADQLAEVLGAEIARQVPPLVEAFYADFFTR
jgi:hypothetical protein